MIMNYYIATSSLNLENILSTESISPMHFYKTRSFGYQNFYQILQLKDFADRILLFSELPNFDIKDEQRENNPMVIQIDTDQQFVEAKSLDKSLECKIYYSFQTIHITPINTKFLFFTDKARVLAYQNCLDSKMCKLVDYFQMQIIQPSKYELYNLIRSIDTLQFQSTGIISNDNQYNKVKGFICGYFIGATKSLSANTAKMLAIQKRIYDILAAIRSNGGQSSAAFNNELSALDKEYMQLDPNVALSRNSWTAFVNSHGISVERLNGLLHELHKESELKRAFCQKEGIILRKTLPEYNLENIEKYGTDISLYTKSLIAKEREQNKENIDLCSQLDINPDYSLAMMVLDDADNSFYNKILSNIVWDNVIGNLDDLRINRFEIVTKITQIMRHIIEETGKEWQGSVEQLYFHHLRQNVKEFTPFNIQEIDNIVLQSLAAFLLKGEDYDSLINYLESNSVSNYQYALSLWGATLGYVQIPRTIISSTMDKSTFIKLYKDAYKLMHRKGLHGKLELNSPQNSECSNNTIVREFCDNSLANRVHEVIIAHPRVKISNEEKSLIEKAISNASDESTFIVILADEGKNLSKGIFRYLQKELYPTYKRERTRKQKQNKCDCSQADLFEKRSIINDCNAKSVIAQCFELGEYRKCVEKMFIDFQKSYQSGYYYRNQIKYKRNNEEVIDHFCKWCLSTKNPSAIPWSKDNSYKMEKLKELLLLKYHD